MHRPRKVGGLGVKKVEDWINGSLARIIWLIFRGSISL